MIMACSSRQRGEAPLMAIACAHVLSAAIVIVWCLAGFWVFTPWEFKLILLASVVIGTLWFFAGVLFDVLAWDNGEGTMAEDIALFIKAISKQKQAENNGNNLSK